MNAKTVGSNGAHPPEHRSRNCFKTIEDFRGDCRYADKFRSVSFMTRIAYPAACGTLSCMLH